MQIYNPIKYKWERDPLGKYAYGATCVKDCPEHLLKDNGACVRACPPKKKVRRVMIKSRRRGGLTKGGRGGGQFH